MSWDEIRARLALVEPMRAGMLRNEAPGGPNWWFDPQIIWLARDKAHVDPTARIDGFVKLECAGGLYVGKRVHVASFVHLGIGGGEIILDDESAVASGARLVSGSAKPNALGCSACVKEVPTVRSFVRVGRRAIVFCNAVVTPGVTLHEGAVVAAGAVVMRDVPAWEIWGGVPARKLGEVPR